VFRIWILPTTDAVVTINKICLNAQPYTLKVDQLGLTDGDLLYFNMQNKFRTEIMVHTINQIL